jgi:hypothetical protein
MRFEGELKESGFLVSTFWLNTAIKELNWILNPNGKEGIHQGCGYQRLTNHRPFPGTNSRHCGCIFAYTATSTYKILQYAAMKSIQVDQTKQTPHVYNDFNLPPPCMLINNRFFHTSCSITTVNAGAMCPDAWVSTRRRKYPADGWCICKHIFCWS